MLHGVSQSDLDRDREQNRYFFVFMEIMETDSPLTLRLFRALFDPSWPLAALRAATTPVLIAVSMQYYLWRGTIGPQLDFVDRKGLWGAGSRAETASDFDAYL